VAGVNGPRRWLVEGGGGWRRRRRREDAS